MKRNENFWTAAGIIGIAIGTGFVSGSEIAAFYAQMGWTSWLGVLAAGVLFGLFTAMTVQLKKKTGAGSFPDIYRRLLGRYSGSAIWTLHTLCLVFAAAMIVNTCAKLGMLMLPMQNAGVWGALIALGLALSLAVLGKNALKTVGAAFVGLLAIMEIALMFSKAPDWAGFPETVDFLMRGSIPAAVLLALLHTAINASISGTLIVRMCRPDAKPEKIGFWAGMVFMLLLAGANLILTLQPEGVSGMALPFVVLASGWGSAGFYISAGMMVLSAVTSLAGIAYSLKAQVSGTPRQLVCLLLLSGASALVVFAAGLALTIWAVLIWILAAAICVLACLYERKRLYRDETRAKTC